jgi:hypothetical protein
MAQDILSLAKSIIRKVWGALTPAAAPAVQPRSQLMEGEATETITSNRATEV